jgi:hypothetical protein
MFTGRINEYMHHIDPVVQVIISSESRAFVSRACKVVF